MKTALIPAAIASFFFLGFFGFFEKPDLIKPEEIVLPDSLKNTVPCYETHVRPMIAGYCTPCHTERKAGFISLNSAENCVRNIDKAMRMAIKGKMPPRDNPKMTGTDIAVLKAWKEGGFKACPAAAK